ncbi:hypothetical protein AMAG_19462 [Allomyces macrogynus ATCC 38327]|uniref:RRM domain-containing protein n=1 Tax=Allomyces macrogynus (strain ATCC 38327) TaxID=578462 RepID=A0A0L0SSC7_ALLM3|nr:hypothetical protein AMAG_19462 [Allomyces macrogynus ATCC 38327]|eukprot:KNE65412.1 hypothetical protein AMAG_19462 [Allomyces macrogynus ATCC 38327]
MAAFNPSAQVTMDLDSIIAANRASRNSSAPAPASSSGAGEDSGRRRRGGRDRRDVGGDAMMVDRSERDRPAPPSSRHNDRDRPTALVSASAAAAAAAASAKISVTNLDRGVTEDDLRELFKRIGRVKSVQLYYDKNGRSQGTAHIHYQAKADAAKAIAQYNNVTLDGRPMQIEFVVAPNELERQVAAVTRTVAAAAPARAATLSSSSAPKESEGSRRRGRRGGRGRDARASGADRPERAERAAPKSAGDLDQDLEAYMAQRMVRVRARTSVPHQGQDPDPNTTLMFTHVARCRGPSGRADGRRRHDDRLSQDESGRLSAMMLLGVPFVFVILV